MAIIHADAKVDSGPHMQCESAQPNCLTPLLQCMLSILFCCSIKIDCLSLLEHHFVLSTSEEMIESADKSLGIDNCKVSLDRALVIGCPN